MGLNRRCRMPGTGQTGRYISERLLNRLRRRYGSAQTTLDELEKGGCEDREECEDIVSVVPSIS